MVEPLAHVPGFALFLGTRLEIAPRHVEPGGIAPDMAERRLRRNLGPAPPDRHD
jgi:hypothetical protein